MHGIVSDKFTVPWPPTANRYWRNVNGKTLTSYEARSYKKVIQAFAFSWKRPCLTGRLFIRIWAHPPDRRRRDLDNLIKVTVDSLQSAGLFADDFQIDRIMIERCEIVEGGKLVISLTEIHKEQLCSTQSNLES